jgi:hypothetical protein
MPDCLLCHSSLKGGAGTAIRPFGVTMSRLGVIGGNPGTLSAALIQARDEGTDSDGDCYGDYDEIIAGFDPNDESDGPESCTSGGPGSYLGPLPRHGCSIARPSDAGWPIASLLAAASLLRRRTRRQRAV